MPRSKKGKSRRTQLKIRAVPLHPMPKSVFYSKIRQACRTGIVPDGIEMTTMDWAKGTGRTLRAGITLDADDSDALKRAYKVLTESDIRIERPS